MSIRPDATGGARSREPKTKRAFLLGLGSFIALGVLGALDEAIRGANAWSGCTVRIDGECHRVGSVIVSIAVCAPLSALAFWKAKAAPPHKSWLHAIGGWLIGFGFLPVVLPAIFILVLFAGALIVQVITGEQIITCENWSCRF
jgi:hypothetical protein